MKQLQACLTAQYPNQPHDRNFIFIFIVIIIIFIIIILAIVNAVVIISTTIINVVVCCKHIYSCTLLQQLGEVARDSIGDSAPPPMEDLLACVKNICQVALLLQQPGRRFKGPAGPQAAAVCIQAHWR